jgi:hypothetical protein
MIPDERSLVKEMEKKPFALLGVNSDTTKEKLKDALAKEQITWRHWWDASTSGPIATAWNISGWPTIYLIDAKGVIRKKGYLRDQALHDAVRELVAEAEHGGVETPR